MEGSSARSLGWSGDGTSRTLPSGLHVVGPGPGSVGRISRVAGPLADVADGAAADVGGDEAHEELTDAHGQQSRVQEVNSL